MKFRILLKSFNNDLIQAASKQLQQTLVNTEATLKYKAGLPIINQ